jgi:hypothetical protein
VYGPAEVPKVAYYGNQIQHKEAIKLERRDYRVWDNFQINPQNVYRVSEKLN